MHPYRQKLKIPQNFKHKNKAISLTIKNVQNSLNKDKTKDTNR